MENTIRLWFVISLTLILTACGTFPKNPKLSQFDKTSGYRFDNLKLAQNNTDDLFVILAFSGGGTRAASLSYGVLEAIRDTQITWKGQQKFLIDEVDMISSVSGGSFTALYYTLFRAGIFEGKFETDFLKKDIEKALISELFKPANLFKLAGSSYGRSDLAAQYYNDNIFSGATFQELIDQGTRPFLMMNGTDMSTGSQFPFIQDQFDLICSDLSALPVSRAVATSSAFPGLLTPLTYENYAGNCDYQPPKWMKYAENDRLIEPERANVAEDRLSYYQRQPWELQRKFVHLVDGGVADNIGLRSIMYALETTDPSYSLMRKINRETIKKLVVIVVNAATDPQTERDSSADVPGVIDVLTSAATIPLDNYSFDTVNRLRQVVKDYNQSVSIRKSCKKLIGNRCPAVDADLDLEKLYAFDLYNIHVAFDYIQDPKTRFEYKNLPTTFSLTSKQVDDLRVMGATLLHQDRDFKRLMQDL